MGSQTVGRSHQSAIKMVVTVYSLFPEMRSPIQNEHAATVSHRAERISRCLRVAQSPLTPSAIQECLLAAGDKWAKGRAGYLAIWSLTDAMVRAGILSGGGQEGLKLVDGPDAIVLYASALTNLVTEQIPLSGELGGFRRSVVGSIQAAASEAEAKFLMAKTAAG